MLMSLIGICLGQLLGVRLYPDTQTFTITISVSAPKLSPQRVESEIISKIEGVLSRIRGVRDSRSVSEFERGIVMLSFDKHTDMEAAQFEVSALLRGIWSSIPPGVSFPTISRLNPESAAERDFMTIAIGESTSENLKSIIYTSILPALSSIDGVGEINISGLPSPYISIKCNLKLCESLGISVDDIAKAIKGALSHNQITYNDSRHIQTIQLGSDTDISEVMQDVMINSAFGDRIPLSRIVSVDMSEDIEGGTIYRVNGIRSATLRIKSLPGVNQIKVADEVRDLLSQLQENSGDSLVYYVSRDTTTEISRSLNDVVMRTLLTLLILLAFAWAAMRSLKLTAIIAAGVVMTLAVSIAVLYLLHVEIHLFTLAGITISLNLLLDNLIVATDYYRTYKNRRFFTAILAATATTIGALSIVLFLSEEIRGDLTDFVIVVIVTLICSLLVAFFVIPAMISVSSDTLSSRNPNKKFDSRVALIYYQLVDWSLHHRWLLWGLTICAFGIPVFLLPAEINGDGEFAKFYNGRYRYRIRPLTDRLLGGTLYVFCNDVVESHDTRKPDEMLYIRLIMPDGTAVSKTDVTIALIETHLKNETAVESFSTTISGSTATIEAILKSSVRGTTTARLLKDRMKMKVSEIGSGSWTVSGIDNDNYYDDPRTAAGNYAVKILGFDYEETSALAADFIKRLKRYPRVGQITIASEESKFVQSGSERIMSLDNDKIVDLSIGQDEIAPKSMTSVKLNNGMSMHIEMEDAVYDEWNTVNRPIRRHTNPTEWYKLSQIGDITVTEAPRKISRENRRYVLVVQFNYNGSDERGCQYVGREIEEVKESLPEGYSIDRVDIRKQFAQDSDEPYIALLVVIAVIFFISSILFNSIRLPLCIIATIPTSFIGAFAAFGMASIKFNSGGFAALVLLCGLTVNASIYVVNQYQLNLKIGSTSVRQALLNSVQSKTGAILLTVVSTILGFLPFLIITDENDFWRALALGTIGGLVSSLFAIYILLPTIILKNDNKTI